MSWNNYPHPQWNPQGSAPQRGYAPQQNFPGYQQQSYAPPAHQQFHSAPFAPVPYQHPPPSYQEAPPTHQQHFPARDPRFSTLQKFWEFQPPRGAWPGEVPLGEDMADVFNGVLTSFAGMGSDTLGFSIDLPSRPYEFCPLMHLNGVYYYRPWTSGREAQLSWVILQTSLKAVTKEEIHDPSKALPSINRSLGGNPNKNYHIHQGPRNEHGDEYKVEYGQLDRWNQFRPSGEVVKFCLAHVEVQREEYSADGAHGVKQELTEKPLPSNVAERPDGQIAQAGVVSGVPDELHRRPVRIYRPSAPSTQSAKATSHHWRVDWDILQGGGRWENPLMGWASSADYMQGTHVKFDTKEAAIHFCEKQGYSYYVQEPQKTKFKPKSYANNYLYSPKPLRIAHTK
ncbi:hypothetical protein MNV49_007485 [Pseudohyphozyma bogoriensis]|nr:hypothetical protein MNV49_007485 [Pseudohyphozyma bogoriensis]